MSAQRRIAYFISPHGFGHAARAAAVMAAMYEIDPSLRFEVFTTVPHWFFEGSLVGPFDHHAVITDIGLVQKTPLREDLPGTVQRLNGFLPFDRSLITNLARLVHANRCELIICDIAPLGIAVAREVGIPSVLVENFTWDWIYRGYTKEDRRMGRFVTHLESLFEQADYHIQTEPVCRYRTADLVTPPISRKARTSRERIREKLEIPDENKAVVITMGGTAQQYTFLGGLKNQPGVHFVIPGGGQSLQVVDNIIRFPLRSDFHHPDLINACDAVIGKGGYSTLAEIYYAGIPFGYVKKPSFAESEILAAFVEKHMSGFPISEDAFQDGSWVSRLPELLAFSRIKRSGPDGASQAAHFILRVLGGERGK